jgi:hypothetical protein
MSDDDIPVEDGDGLMSAMELLDELDTDGSGWIESDEFNERDTIDKELDKIRSRRDGTQRRFPRGVEDFVLLAGLAYCLMFFGGMLLMSAGVFGQGVDLDANLSATTLDFDECEDPGDQVWLNAWIDDSHNIRIDAYNVPTAAKNTDIRWKGSEGNWISEVNSTTIKIDYSNWPDGAYHLDISFTNHTAYVQSEDPANHTAANGTLAERMGLEIEIASRAPSMAWLPWVDDSPTKEAEIIDDGPRACWTTSELGGWAWILMTAEWGGGRETAMLAGGSAGVPPWWMGFVSLSMSVCFLFVQYPLMYRFYHREEDDELNLDQVERLVQKAIQKAEKKCRIEVDWDAWKIQERDISIDVLVPYRTTMETHVDAKDVRWELVSTVLSEFKAFGLMKPLHLQARATDSTQGIFQVLGQGLDKAQITLETHGEREALVEDYSKFFETVGTLAGVEDRAIKAVKKWFVKTGLRDRGSRVYSDDQALYVRVIYRPNQRFAFFRFKRSFVDLEADIENHMRLAMQDILSDRDLIVSARNEVQTLADRSAAGRVETGGEGHQQALVAKQEGLVGTILQNQIMGDVLSTVEFVAHEKRDFINRWGFWGLIVFVWIPFMASGVLVGAMLGLLSRMNFLRVLIACSIGGFAASITWAYTARGIIEVMERYHAEALIPWLIAVVIIFAVVHLRTSKRRRLEALFKETQLFFGGASDAE